MQFEYSVGYDGQGFITVGYSFVGPMGDRVDQTFQSANPAVLTKSQELIEIICSAHSLTRKPAPPAPAPEPAAPSADPAV